MEVVRPPGASKDQSEPGAGASQLSQEAAKQQRQLLTLPPAFSQNERVGEKRGQAAIQAK